ncbi:unnamed protein product [Closterium sp. NIES-65]|nr:unnamed protein product [Closterium sp. NIES-65]
MSPGATALAMTHLPSAATAAAIPSDCYNGGPWGGLAGGGDSAWSSGLAKCDVDGNGGAGLYSLDGRGNDDGGGNGGGNGNGKRVLSPPDPDRHGEGSGDGAAGSGITNAVAVAMTIPSTAVDAWGSSSRSARRSCNANAAPRWMDPRCGGAVAASATRMASGSTAEGNAAAGFAATAATVGGVAAFAATEAAATAEGADEDDEWLSMDVAREWEGAVAAEANQRGTRERETSSTGCYGPSSERANGSRRQACADRAGDAPATLGTLATAALSPAITAGDAATVASDNVSGGGSDWREDTAPCGRAGAWEEDNRCADTRHGGNHAAAFPAAGEAGCASGVGGSHGGTSRRGEAQTGSQGGSHVPPYGGGEDAREDRKQRRMVSNRESARRSRLRKQTHVDAMKLKACRLQGHNTDMAVRLTTASENLNQITRENRLLRSQATDLSRRLQRLHLGAASSLPGLEGMGRLDMHLGGTFGGPGHALGGPGDAFAAKPTAFLSGMDPAAAAASAAAAAHCRAQYGLGLASKYSAGTGYAASPCLFDPY